MSLSRKYRFFVRKVKAASIFVIKIPDWLHLFFYFVAFGSLFYIIGTGI